MVPRGLLNEGVLRGESGDERCGIAEVGGAWGCRRISPCLRAPRLVGIPLLCEPLPRPLRCRRFIPGDLVGTVGGESEIGARDRFGAPLVTGYSTTQELEMGCGSPARSGENRQVRPPRSPLHRCRDIGRARRVGGVHARRRRVHGSSRPTTVRPLHRTKDELYDCCGDPGNQ